MPGAIARRILRPSGADPIVKPSHGFRCASPVATVKGPSGAKWSRMAQMRGHVSLAAVGSQGGWGSGSILSYAWRLKHDLK
jgi:hypothetical protein